jgi:putative FmdB family regulatory protein
MPIYEYACRQCGLEFEKLVQAGQPALCPSCQSPRVLRRISLVGVRTGAAAGPSAGSAGGCCGGGCACR